MPPRTSLLVFVLLFGAGFSVLQLAFLNAGRSAEYWLVDRATVAVAAFVIGVLDTPARVRAEGPRLISPEARLLVLRGCEGTELYFLWIAGILAFPAPWRYRVAGLLAGILAAFCLNQVRVVGLFYIVRDYRQHFELAHAYVAPTLFVVLLGLMFWRWTAAVPAR